MIHVLDERSGKVSILPSTCIGSSRRNKNPYSNRKKKMLFSSPITITIIIISVITFIWFISSLSSLNYNNDVQIQQKQNKIKVELKSKDDVSVLSSSSSLKDNLINKKAASAKVKAKATKRGNGVGVSGGAMGILHEIEGYFHLERDTKRPKKPKDKNKDEWDKIKELLSTHADGKRFLIGWPTIPTSHKGADSRAIDAIIFLTSIGYNVDLIYWRDYAAEVDKAWDDTEDRERLLNAGVHRILGPYQYNKLSDSHTFISSYFAFMFWLWPDGPYLECIHDMVNHIMKHNGNTRIISAVDDTGVAVRNLYASRGRHDITTDEVESYLLSYKRHPDLIGSDQYIPEDHTAKRTYNSSLTDDDFLSVRSPVYLFHLEMYLYVMSDITIGLNEHIIQYLSDMVPATPSKVLSYISPIQPKSNDMNIPFTMRKKDYIFFGYNNPANKDGIDYFVNNIMELVDKDAIFHIAGVVTYNIPQFCECTESANTGITCSSLKTNILCHGDLNDEQLESLIQSMRVAINPVREPSGVATKTCRAMAYGTPVVVSTLDGTFNDKKTFNDNDYGARKCDINDNQCYANSINELLTNEEYWTISSNAAKSFIINNYGSKPYSNDWLHILNILYYKRKIQILIDGNAQKDGQSMSAQNWYIANMLASEYSNDVEVTVIGDLSPSINGVNHALPYPDLNNPKILHEESSGGLQMEYKYFTSPFITGYTPNIILKQNWPPSPHIYPLKYCSLKCRVIQILPWEFGSLPKKWIKPLNKYVDILAAPSQYNRQIFLNSGYDNDRTTILPAGVDCDLLLPISKQRHKDMIQNNNSNDNNNPVTFIFSGGLLPRKGIDIILQEFHNVFCTTSSSNESRNVKLIVQTSYELGYAIEEYNSFNELIKQCSASSITIDLQRNSWIKDTSEHKEFLKNGDIYFAPFRSEGFGLPIVEALLLGLRVIVSTGGTSADDFIANNIEESNNNMIYPVPSHEVPCTHYPCIANTKKKKNQLCVFPPCYDTGKDNIWKCSCDILVKEPTWFEADREQLRIQILKAYNDVLYSRKQKQEQHSLLEDDHNSDNNIDEKNPKQFCWSNLSSKYKNKLASILKTPVQRKDIKSIEYFFIEPEKYHLERVKQKEYNKKIARICMRIIVFFTCCFLIFFVRLRRKELNDILSSFSLYERIDYYTPRRLKLICSKIFYYCKNSWIVRYYYKNVLSKGSGNVGGGSSGTSTSSNINSAKSE